MDNVMLYIVIGIISYLLGSISTGLVLAKIVGGPNLREVGSKNTGASNVLRTMGLKSGLIVFVGDCGKALLSCWIGQLIAGHPGMLVAGMMVIIGHNWPVFFQFKGGKGVASSCAVMLMCYPTPALICFLFAIVLIAITRYISLGSMAMLVLYAVLVITGNTGDVFAIIWVLALAVLCIARHHANIARLIAGTENKLGSKKKQ